MDYKGTYPSVSMGVDSGRLALYYSGTIGFLGASVYVELCPDGSEADMSGYQFSADVYFDGGPLTQDTSYLYASIEPSGEDSASVIPVAGTWMKVHGTWTSASASTLRIGFVLLEAWTGVVYIDNVQLTPP